MNIHPQTSSVRVVYNWARESRAMHKDDTQRGNQLGDYRLGPRFKGTGDVGRIYRAHNVVTGAPALVLQRTERQADEQPMADWQVRVTSSVSPAFLALEVERAPATGVPADVAGELIFMLGDAEEIANAVVERPETMPHLRAVPRPPPARQVVTSPPAPRPSRDWRRPSLAAGVAALAAAALLHLGGASDSGFSGNMIADAELAQVDAGWGADAEMAEDLVLTGMSDEAPLLLAKALPRKPFSNQKRPPCDKQLEVEVNKGCWVRLKVDGICPPDKAYEHQGECLLPAAKQESAPTAFSRQPLAFDRQ